MKKTAVLLSFLSVFIFSQCDDKKTDNAHAHTYAYPSWIEGSWKYTGGTVTVDYFTFFDGDISRYSTLNGSVTKDYDFSSEYPEESSIIKEESGHIADSGGIYYYNIYITTTSEVLKYAFQKTDSSTTSIAFYFYENSILKGTEYFTKQ